MEYNILTGFYTFDLEKAVRDYIKDGWKPQGGVTKGHELLYQAMIKEDD